MLYNDLPQARSEGTDWLQVLRDLEWQKFLQATHPATTRRFGVGAGTPSAANPGATAATGGPAAAGTAATTGSRLGKILGTAGSIGQILAEIAALRAKARADTAELGLGRDRNATARYLAQVEGLGLVDRGALDRAALQERGTMDRATTDLLRRRFQLEAPGTRLSAGLRAAAAANMQDARATGTGNLPVIHFAGGPRPSAIGPEGRQFAQDTLRQLTAAQLKGDEFPDIPGVQVPPPTDFSAIMKPPEETPLPEAGRGDTALNWAAIIGSLLGAFSPNDSTLAGQYARNPSRRPIAPYEGG